MLPQKPTPHLFNSIKTILQMIPIFLPTTFSGVLLLRQDLA